MGHNFWVLWKEFFALPLLSDYFWARLAIISSVRVDVSS